LSKEFENENEVHNFANEASNSLQKDMISKQISNIKFKAHFIRMYKRQISR